MKHREASPSGSALPEGSVRNHGSGYLMIKVNGRWVMQHRHVMAKKLGRELGQQERVHHKDGNRANNHPDNLELWVIRGKSKKDPAGQRWKDLIDALPLKDGMSADEVRQLLLSHLITAPKRGTNE